MSVPHSTFSTQLPLLAGLTSESVLLAAQAMTSPSATSVGVVMETPDPEVILPSKDETVATRPLVQLCDPIAVTLPLHSTPMQPSIHETPVRFGTQWISPVSPGPPVLSP